MSIDLAHLRPQVKLTQRGWVKNLHMGNIGDIYICLHDHKTNVTQSCFGEDEYMYHGDALVSRCLDKGMG